MRLLMADWVTPDSCAPREKLPPAATDRNSLRSLSSMVSSHSIPE
jgi:hypothetical protein